MLSAAKPPAPALLLRWRQKRQNSQWQEKAFASHDPQWRETFQALVRNQLHVRLIYLPSKSSANV